MLPLPNCEPQTVESVICIFDSVHRRGELSRWRWAGAFRQIVELLLGDVSHRSGFSSSSETSPRCCPYLDLPPKMMRVLRINRAG